MVARMVAHAPMERARHSAPAPKVPIPIPPGRGPIRVKAPTLAPRDRAGNPTPAVKVSSQTRVARASIPTRPGRAPIRVKAPARAPTGRARDPAPAVKVSIQTRVARASIPTPPGRAPIQPKAPTLAPRVRAGDPAPAVKVSIQTRVPTRQGRGPTPGKYRPRLRRGGRGSRWRRSGCRSEPVRGRRGRGGRGPERRWPARRPRCRRAERWRGGERFGCRSNRGAGNGRARRRADRYSSCFDECVRAGGGSGPGLGHRGR